MNKSIIKLFLLGGLAITSITSCTDNYMDYNKNPSVSYTHLTLPTKLEV